MLTQQPVSAHQWSFLLHTSQSHTLTLPNQQTHTDTVVVDGYSLVAKALKAVGVEYMFGVVGIPVTRLGVTAQVCVYVCLGHVCVHTAPLIHDNRQTGCMLKQEEGIRFIAFRNEQARALILWYRYICHSCVLSSYHH